MTSVIYVDLSSESEEEGPPGAKRARREHAKQTIPRSLPKVLQIPKSSLAPVPATVIKTSAGGTGTITATGTVIGASYRPMHIPSGITVTKHNNNYGNINIVKSAVEKNNNNTNNNNNNVNNNINNNNVKSKPLRVSGTQNATTAWSKAPTTLATITSVPVPQPVKLSPASKTAQKSAMQQLLTQNSTLQQQTQQQKQKTVIPIQHKLTQQQQQQQQKSLNVSPQTQTHQKISLISASKIVQQKPQLLTTQKHQISLQHQQKLQSVNTKQSVKSKQQQQNQQMPQRLPTLQKRPLPASSTPTSLQQKTAQLLKQPPPAHSGTSQSLHKQKQPQQQPSLPPPPPALLSINSVSTLTLPSLAKISPMPILSKPSLPMPLNNNNSSAARTLPYKTKSVATLSTVATSPASATSATSPTLKNVQHQPQSSVTAGATPPLRLLATPPHCAAALNEPLLLNLPPTTSITPQLTPTTTPPPPAAVTKITFPAASISPVNKTPVKRVQPITVLKKSDEEWRKHVATQQQQQIQQQQIQQQQIQQQQQQEQQKPKEPTPTIVLVESPPTTPPTEKVEVEQVKSKTPPVVTTGEATAVTVDAPAVPAARATLVTEYAALLQLCRELDKSKDMERLIETKLINYYYSVHENFVRSRGFRKQLEQVMERIRNEPDMIYVHVKSIVDELKVRRKAKSVPLLHEEAVPEEKPPAAAAAAPTPGESTDSKVVEADAPPATPSTGNKRTDERIRKLNRTLYTITKRISALEQAEVDWNDDDDSSYLQVERYKKRACQIYEKICDLTGESKSAHRQMKQPIMFKDTAYPQFNRTLSAFVNRMHEFPDYHDVLQLLEHCNKDKNLGLAIFEMKRIAHDAFVKVGRLLQARRKIDLYETVTHFTANAKDPAASDAALLAKLNDNNKKQTKITDILEKFAREQELSTEEHREARLKEKQLQAAAAAAVAAPTSPNEKAAADNDDQPCTSAQAVQEADVAQTSQTAENVLTNGVDKHADSENESESDDDDDDDESDEDVDTFVDNFKANGDLSDGDVDAESESEMNAAPKTTAAAAHVIVNNLTRIKTAAPNEILQNNKDNDKAEVESKTATCKAPNGQLKDEPMSKTLKVISVTSLNASVCTNDHKNSQSNSIKTRTQEQQPPQKQKQKQKRQQQQKQNTQTKMSIDAEIIISDEES